MWHKAKSAAVKSSNQFDALEAKELTDPDNSDYDSDIPSLQEIEDDEDDDNDDNKQDWEDIIEISNEEVRLNGCL